MPIPIPTPQTPSTPPFNFIAGMYRLSRWRLPYFSTTMTFRDAAQHLRLVNDFPGVEKLEWRLEELYQRDVDWPRVERQIVPYLRSEEKPQFFNALTVALLPIRSNEVAETYDAHGWNPPGPVNPSDTPFALDVGAISFCYYQSWTDPTAPAAKLGQVRWNPDQVFSVAIDGQHRLAAIKSFVEAGGGTPAATSEVPVILLVFDERLGFSGIGEQTSMVELLRKLFIDLNKHAVKVDRTRQILLDDVDPHSLCVRRLVEPRLTDGMSCLELPVPRMPLSTVDWHTGEAKVDSGPYITTILGLDWCVTKLLGARPIADYMDYGAVERQLRAFRQSLGLDLAAAMDELEHVREFGIRPFSYRTENGNNQVEQIADAFAMVWGTAIVRIFTRLLPYANLLKLRVNQGTLSAEFVNWYYLFERKNREAIPGRATREYSQMLSHLQTRATQPVSEVSLKANLEQLGTEKEGSLAFTVVFQRALIEAFWHFEKLETGTDDGDVDSVDELFEGESNGDAEQGDDCEGVSTDVAFLAQQTTCQANRFVEILNDAIGREPEWLSHDFAFGTGAARRSYWLGALLSLDQNIDFSQSASVRSAELILWVPLLVINLEQQGIASAASFDTFWARLDDDRDFNAVEKSLKRSIARYRKATVDRILKSDDAYGELSEEEYENRVLQEVKPRLRWAWRIASGSES